MAQTVKAVALGATVMVPMAAARTWALAAVAVSMVEMVETVATMVKVVALAARAARAAVKGARAATVAKSAVTEVREVKPTQVARTVVLAEGAVAVAALVGSAVRTVWGVTAMTMRAEAAVAKAASKEMKVARVATQVVAIATMAMAEASEVVHEGLEASAAEQRVAPRAKAATPARSMGALTGAAAGMVVAAREAATVVIRMAEEWREVAKVVDERELDGA